LTSKFKMQGPNTSKRKLATIGPGKGRNHVFQMIGDTSHSGAGILCLSALENPCITFALKAGLSALRRLLGRPKQRIIFVIRTWTTSLARSVLQGKSSTHPVNMSTNTNSSFDFLILVPLAYG
jgi:hypothetical protein